MKQMYVQREIATDAVDKSCVRRNCISQFLVQYNVRMIDSTEHKKQDLDRDGWIDHLIE